MVINVPEDVKTIIDKLNRNEYEAFVVGGCVRDSVLGREPGDWDVAASAMPHEVCALFEKTIETGIKHGTVTVVLNNRNYEITTYRIDGEYTDARRPDRVEFTTSLEDDLSRRDFTVNAMAYHPGKGLIDPFNGMEDIQKQVIRAVGNPEKRFREDALRMLRAIRFSAQLDFGIDTGTLRSIEAWSHLIRHVSQERVRDELTKTLVSKNPMKFSLLRDTGLLKYILPEFDICFEVTQNNPYHIYNVALHTLHAVSNIEKDPVLRWTMLLHDTGKAVTKTTDESGKDHFYGHPVKSMLIAEAVLKRLRFDNKSIKRICRLVKFHDRDIVPSLKPVRKAIVDVGGDIFCDLLKVKEADYRSQNPDYLKRRLDRLDRVRDMYREISEKQQCLSLSELAVNGHNLIDLGIKEGRDIRLMLNKLLEAVIEDPALNDREKLLDMAKKHMRQ